MKVKQRNHISKETKYSAKKSIITYTEDCNNIEFRYILDETLL